MLLDGEQVVWDTSGLLGLRFTDKGWAYGVYELWGLHTEFREVVRFNAKQQNLHCR